MVRKGSLYFFFFFNSKKFGFSQVGAGNWEPQPSNYNTGGTGFHSHCLWEGLPE